MSFFNRQEPILRRKQPQLDIQDLKGLIYWEWKLNGTSVFTLLYTRIDQVFLLWGWIVGVIFLTPQFFPTFAWTHQALLGTVLSMVGLGGMAAFAWFWVKVEQLRWLLHLWGGLVLLGLGLTNYGIFVGVGAILANLCSIWLILCGFGYVFMAVGLRSRTFLIAGGLHGATIALLHLVPAHQFLITALVMAGTLFLLAEVQWDMRSPVASPVLSSEQTAFNQRQHQLRRTYPNA